VERRHPGLVLEVGAEPVLEEQRKTLRIAALDGDKDGLAISLLLGEVRKVARVAAIFNFFFFSIFFLNG
jgi:hypothetical protein